MKKLVRGIIDFKKHVRPGYIKTFNKLSTGQKPDVLMVACSDSRVVPNLFSSTDPGDIFTHRNVGNIMPPANDQGVSVHDESEAASIEFAVEVLKVKDIIVCGHSNCGAMHTLYNETVGTLPHIKAWLRHANGALGLLEERKDNKSPFGMVDQLSQWNVHQQLENIRSYPIVKNAIKTRKLRMHAWWFDILSAEVYAYSPEEQRYMMIDEDEAEKILERIND